MKVLQEQPGYPLCKPGWHNESNGYNLLRIVTAEPNTLSADIRRVTFRLSYMIYGRNLSYELTTIRAKDQ